MQQNQITDVVYLFTVIAAMVFSKEAAFLIGPYMVIVIAASVGASFALSRRDKTTRASAVWFFIRVVGLAVLLTAGLAALVHSYRPDLQERFLLAPIALMVGFIGDRWPEIFRKVVSVILAGIDLMRSGGKP